MAGDTVTDIKDRLSIEDVVRPYVKLTKAGKSLIGLCPFHKEKTPSFHVSVDRGTYHCFGCGEGGDIFSFVQKVEGVDFKEALRLLAEKAGVQIISTATSSESTARIERLRQVIVRAAEWYTRALAGSPAEAYAASRGLSSDTVRSWRLGYAPEGWRVLLEALVADGYSVEELLAVGLIKEADGKPGTYYDRFRSRLLFPIADARGKIVAFTGRTLLTTDVAKYLNSPETSLYHKSDILFGMDRAKDAIRVRGFTLLVEGQMDVLHAHQAGFTNTVGLSGTALSERHLALMKRYSENLMLVLDADAAGLEATAKSAALALAHGLRVKVVRLPTGRDPAELIQEDPKAFSLRVQEAKSVVDFFLAVLLSREPDPLRLLGSIERVVLPLIAVTESPLERDHYIQRTARSLSLSPETIRESLHRLSPRMHAGGARTELSRASAPPTVSAQSLRIAREQQLRAIMHVYTGTPLAERVKAEYLRITGVLEESSHTLPEQILFQTGTLFGEEPGEGTADELLQAFEETVVREAYQEAVVALRKAEFEGRIEDIHAAGERCAELAARLALLTH